MTMDNCGFMLLTIYICLYSVYCVKMRTLLGGELTLWIRDQTGQQTPHYFRSDATAQDLYSDYTQVSQETGTVLSFGGSEIKNDAQQALSDLGICSEAVIDAFVPLSDVMNLFKMFENVQNIATAKWWSHTLWCVDNQQSQQCQSNYYCDRWRNKFTCVNGKFTKIGASYLGLHGNLDLNHIPNELKELDLSFNQFTNINLLPLKYSKLEWLCVSYNRLSTLSLDNLKGSSLNTLYCSRNQINEINLGGLNGVLLNELDLNGNNIRTVNLTGLIGSKLKALYLNSNPIDTFYGWNDLRHPSVQLDEIDFDGCETNTDYMQFKQWACARNEIQHENQMNGCIIG